MSYPRGLRANYALDTVNVYAADLGEPALAVADYFVASTDMVVGPYTLAHTASPDGLARNVTLTRAVVAAGADTPGTVTVTGTDLDGNVITEALTPGADTILVAGAKAFASISSIVGVGWVIAGGNDTIVFGFGNLVGLPSSLTEPQNPGSVSAVHQVLTSYLGGAPITPVVSIGAIGDDPFAPELCTVDASSGTYDGTKHLYVLIAR